MRNTIGNPATCFTPTSFFFKRERQQACNGINFKWTFSTVLTFNSPSILGKCQMLKQQFWHLSWVLHFALSLLGWSEEVVFYPKVVFLYKCESLQRLHLNTVDLKCTKKYTKTITDIVYFQISQVSGHSFSLDLLDQKEREITTRCRFWLGSLSSRRIFIQWPPALTTQGSSVWRRQSVPTERTTKGFPPC